MIIRKKQGQGKPTKIYVMNFSKPISKSNTKVLQRIKSLTECKSKNKTSGITSKTAVQTSEKPKSEEKRAEVKTSKKPKSELDCSSTIPKSRLLKNRSLDFDKAEVLTSEISHISILRLTILRIVILIHLSIILQKLMGSHNRSLKTHHLMD